MFKYIPTLAFLMFALALNVQPLQAQSGEKASAEGDAAAAEGNMVLKLKRGITLSGTPVEMESIKMTALFGEVSIPTHTIAGIRFGDKPGEQTTVVLRNGDALTGETGLSQMKFVSAWGEATVNVAEVQSVVFSRDLAWNSVRTPTGVRWQLNKVRPGTYDNAR